MILLGELIGKLDGFADDFEQFLEEVPGFAIDGSDTTWRRERFV